MPSAHLLIRFLGPMYSCSSIFASAGAAPLDSTPILLTRRGALRAPVQQKELQRPILEARSQKLCAVLQHGTQAFYSPAGWWRRRPGGGVPGEASFAEGSRLSGPASFRDRSFKVHRQA